jgi:hypothetical protein
MRLGKGYVICDVHTNEILAVAKVAGEALYTAMQLEAVLNDIPQIYSLEEYNKRNAQRNNFTSVTPDWECSDIR